MIEHLKIGRAAYFYRRKKSLTDDAVANLFTALRHNSQEPSQNLFRAVRVESGSARYSAVCFSFERQPSFLDAQAVVWERIFGFLLIVEKDDLIAVMKSGLDLPSEFKTEYFLRVSDDRIEAAIARSDSTFEQIRLRSMATSKHALRSRPDKSGSRRNCRKASKMDERLR